MNYRNQEEIDEFVGGEAKARHLLLPYYRYFGLNITNTIGTRLRDIVGIGIASGKEYKIEEKFRQGDFGDFLIEIIQDMNREPIDLGWFYKTEADLISYVICDGYWQPNKVYLVRWQGLKKWLLENWWAVPSSAVISGRGIGLTLNLAVAWKNIPDEFIRKYILAEIVLEPDNA